MRVLCGSERWGHRWTGAVRLAVDPGARAVVTPGSHPWKVGQPTNEHLQSADFSVREGVRRAREKARLSSEPCVSYLNTRGEPVYSLRLNRLRDHADRHKSRKACGHLWCAMCDGYVDPVAGTAVAGPGPIIKCNRRRREWGEYEFLFGESFAGSAVLTEAMVRALPSGKVRDPRDRLYDLSCDLLDKRVYERAKKEAKERTCFYDHYSPPCETFTAALRGMRGRSIDQPYRTGDHPKVDDHNVALLRTVALCEIQHTV